MLWLAADAHPLVDELRAAGETVITSTPPDEFDDPDDYPLGALLARHAPDVLLCPRYDRAPGLPKGAVLLWRRAGSGRRIVGIATADPKSWEDQAAGRRRGCSLPVHALDVYLTADPATAALAARTRRVVLDGQASTFAGLLEALRARAPGIYPA